MSSPSAYTLVDRVNDAGYSNRKRSSVTRFQIPASIGMDTTSLRHPHPSVHSTVNLNVNIDYETSINRDNILFVYLDFHSHLPSNSVASLRTINNDVHTYTDLSTCLKLLQSSHDRIFFITTSDDIELLEDIHPLHSIEAIFILNSEAHVNSRFPKLYGVYEVFEELLKGLKESIEWFEQTQMELFVFERDRIFLWSQLWRDEFIKSKKSKTSSNKEKLVQIAENYYQGNLKLHQSIIDFDQTYNKNNALQWCFISPFPSRFILRTLCTHNPEHLKACQFLLLDASHIIQQQSVKKTSCELYRGMKTTNEFLEKLENHIGKLVCPKGFLLCSQSRKTALETASSLEHRPDLLPVLFKITYDTSVPIAEIPMKEGTSLLVFDIFTAFRIKYVTRNQVSIVKIELADEDGRNLAKEYRMKHESENIKDLMDHLITPPKPPTRLPPLQHSALPRSPSGSISSDGVQLSMVPEDDIDMQAKEFINNGQIDEAISIYQLSQPESARACKNIAILYSEKKGDYNSAIIYYKKALNIEEKKGEDVTDTLSQLGVVHHNRQEFDLALACYSRALHLRKKARLIDQALVANSLIGMANAYWGQKNLTEALNYAQQALTLNESFESGNDLNIAVNLAILANIHYNLGNVVRALELATRALGLLERCTPSDSLPLASIVNNLATIQVANGLLSEARQTFDRALKICQNVLPEGHPSRIAMETNIQRIAEMERKKENTNL